VLLTADDDDDDDDNNTNNNSVASVRELTIVTKRPSLIGEVSADRGSVSWSARRNYTVIVFASWLKTEILGVLVPCSVLSTGQNLRRSIPVVASWTTTRTALRGKQTKLPATPAPFPYVIQLRSPNLSSVSCETDFTCGSRRRRRVWAANPKKEIASET
jgi:hypothetical protein